MLESKRDYGRAIRTVRAARDMTQIQVAEAAGVKPSYLSMLERGERRSPSVEVLMRVSRAMGTSQVVLDVLASSREERSSWSTRHHDLMAGIVMTDILR
jgi:transcriptional regulator with XRE-family HTH domain